MFTIKPVAAAAIETLDGAGDNVTDNAPALRDRVGPGGSIAGGGYTRARYAKNGFYRLGGLVDVMPSVSLNMDARGGVILKPKDNLPGTTPEGSEAAVLRLVRTAPDVNYALAYAPVLSGFNLDFRTTNQVNQVHGVRVPNPNPGNNPLDADPAYNTNKDYVAGALAYSDIVGASGSGYVVESGNGRFDVFSARALSCSLNGFDLAGNDVVMSGHWAAGGNLGFGVKAGQAAGFFATTGNIWGNSATRSATCGAMQFFNRKLFGVGFSEFNDWLRMDGGSNDPSKGFYRGGVIANNVFAPFDSNFLSDGVAIDTTPGTDSRLQANVGVTGYQSLTFAFNTHTRTERVLFPTPSNVGGDLNGAYGTAPQYLYDIGDSSMVTVVESYCSAPNVKPYTGTTNLMPANVHGGGQLNYLMFDPATGLMRKGAMGNGVHSHTMIDCDEAQTPSAVYTTEIGDGTINNGANYRHALYGDWELSNGIKYQDSAYDRHAYTTNFSRTVKAQHVLQRIVVTGAGPILGTITLPTDLPASQPLRILVTGPAVIVWTWTTSGAGSINAQTQPLPFTSVGLLVVDLWYSHDANTWEVLSVLGQGGTYGRTDNVATPPGVIGELIASRVGSGAAVNLLSASIANITSVTLTAGDWTVEGSVIYTSTAATTSPTQVRAGLSTANGSTILTTQADTYSNRSLPYGVIPSGTDFDTLQVGPTRITVPFGSTQQVWLNARAVFGGSGATASAFGALRAVRTA